MLRRIILVLVLLTAVRSAEATPISPAEWTLSAKMHESECVVRAVIVRVDRVPAPIATPHNDSLWIKVQLEVRETLQGSPSTSLAFYDRYHDPYFPEWAGIKFEQLFFFETGAQAASQYEKYLEPLAWVENWEPISLNIPGWPVITDDLRRLTTGDDVLAEARRVPKLRWISSSKRSDGIRLPDDIAKPLGLDQDEFLEVALTEQTMQLARGWIASADPQLQWCGAEVLVNQQSAENAAALQRFAWSMQEQDYYGCEARGRILQLLSKWGVKDLPPLVLAAPVFDVHQRSAWVSLGGWIVLPLIYVVRRLRREFSVRSLAWWTIVSTLLVLGIRSYWPSDAVTRGSWDLVLERGNLYVEQQERSKAGFPSPLVFCSPKELLRYQAHWYVPMDWKLNDQYEGLRYYNRGERAHSYAEKFWPTRSYLHPGPMTWRARLKGPIWQIPMWLILSLLILPRTVGWGRHWTRMLRSQPRGFPVEVTTRPETDRKA